MNDRSSAPVSPLRRRAAWVLLLVFLMGHTPVLPAAAGLLAWIDGGHEVQFAATRDGVVLKLHHPTGAGAPRHVHPGWLSLVTAFTRNSGTGHSDHMVALPTGRSSDVTGDMATVQAPEWPAAEVVQDLPAVFARHGSDAAVALPHPVQPAAPPPVTRVLQSVQLLI